MTVGERGLGDDDVAREMCVAQNELLVDRGFAGGQPGGSDTGGSATFCFEYRAFRERFPRIAPDYGDDGFCVDLTACAHTAPGARLTEAHLDGSNVDELLRAVGLDDLAPAATALTTVSLRGGLSILRHLLASALAHARPAGDLGATGMETRT